MKSYNEKRDFSKTGEPRDVPSKKKNKQPIFVIQKHDATNLHYDFRLEIDNTLKSCSVPKGPSTDPSIKRMAIPTEDHPIAYADFEGVIPKGEYGGGTVMIWDTGTIESNKKMKMVSLFPWKKALMQAVLKSPFTEKSLKAAIILWK
jgi:DNA ligase D-like protein (predicted 3'-phosphoesterase)